MKKIIILLAVALMALPAWAVDVTFTATDEGNGVVRINYAWTGGTRVRAFALNLGTDCNIISVSDVNPGFQIYPGTIQISGNTVTNAGTPVAVQSQLPGDTLPGLHNYTGATLEMASLYQGDANAPASSGILCRVTVQNVGNVNISSNVSRCGNSAGIVMEDLSAKTSNLPIDVSVSGPTCASCAYDQDGDGYVTFDDMASLIAQISPTDPDWYFVNRAAPGSECFDADGDGYVTFDDMSQLIGWLSPTDPDWYYECGAH